MDRAYLDFERLYYMHQCLTFFVVREKHNFNFRRLYFCNIIHQKKYPEKLRRIKYYDKERDIYETNDSGFKLINKIEEDWNLFSNVTISSKVISDILQKISFSDWNSNTEVRYSMELACILIITVGVNILHARFILG